MSEIQRIFKKLYQMLFYRKSKVDKALNEFWKE